MAVPATASDPAAAYNPPVIKHEGPGRLHRAALLLTHLLHIVCCVIVLCIAAYLIAEWHSRTGEKFCVALAIPSALLFSIAMARSMFGLYRSVLPAFMLLLSCLWLAASILTSVQYTNTSCVDIIEDTFYVSDTTYCALTRALIAWSFLAFLTCLLGTILEALLWRYRRHVGKPSVVDSPDPPRGISTAPPAPDTVV